MNAQPPPREIPSPGAQPERLVALDAFRGAIMLLMASSGFGLPQIAKAHPDHPVWSFLGRQCEHAAWVGCTLWDLIQPAFMFMVGVALPWSLANRRARGQSSGRLFAHALGRSLALIGLAVFLTSAWSPRTEWVFTNVLAQIGLAYPFLFLVALGPPRAAWIAAFAVLAAYGVFFAVHPLPAPGFDTTLAGVPGDWPRLAGWAAHWDKNTNAAAAFDVWFLNLFPRQTPFVFSTGGYQTLNFIPSLATMIFGLIAGREMRRDAPVASKVVRLIGAGVFGLAVGGLLGALGICPIVKRIWTPSWALFSGGWVCLILAGFVAVIEGRGWKRWAFPLVVAGLNPITLYCLWQLSGGFVRENLKRHLGPDIFELLGSPYAPLVERCAVLLAFWLVLFAMYRRRIFLRI
ncbi:MAG: acyltransferase family protein [Limisphaerales bacterium]